MALADRGTRMALIGIPAGLIALWSLVELVRALRPRRETPSDEETGLGEVDVRDPEASRLVLV
jgi:signal peptidase